MTVQLPAPPQATTTTFSLTSNAVTQDPIMGGPSTRLARLGDRWSMSFKMRSLSNLQATQFIASLLQGLSAKVRAYVIQPEINPNGGAAGTFSNASSVTTTVGQAAFTGLSPNFTFQSGQFFNVTTNGVAYLYQTTSSVTSDGNGNATISFQPLLKAAPNSGDQVNFQNPVIEGFLQGNSQSWDLSLVQTVGLSFAVKEAQ